MSNDKGRIKKVGKILIGACLFLCVVVIFIHQENEKKQAKRVMEAYILSFSPNIRTMDHGYNTIDPEAQDFLVFRKSMERSLEKLIKKVDPNDLKSRFHYMKIVVCGNKCFARLTAELSLMENDFDRFRAQNYEMLLTKQDDGQWKISKAISDDHYENGAYDSTDPKVIDLQYRLIGKLPKVERDPRFVFSHHLKFVSTKKLLHRLDPIVYETNPHTLLKLEEENQRLIEENLEHDKKRNQLIRNERKENKDQRAD